MCSAAAGEGGKAKGLPNGVHLSDLVPVKTDPIPPTNDVGNPEMQCEIFDTRQVRRSHSSQYCNAHLEACWHQLHWHGSNYSSNVSSLHLLAAYHPDCHRLISTSDTGVLHCWLAGRNFLVFSLGYGQGVVQLLNPWCQVEDELGVRKPGVLILQKNAVVRDCYVR